MTITRTKTQTIRERLCWDTQDGIEEATPQSLAEVGYVLRSELAAAEQAEQSAARVPDLERQRSELHAKWRAQLERAERADAALANERECRLANEKELRRADAELGNLRAFLAEFDGWERESQQHRMYVTAPLKVARAKCEPSENPGELPRAPAAEPVAAAWVTASVSQWLATTDLGKAVGIRFDARKGKVEPFVFPIYLATHPCPEGERLRPVVDAERLVKEAEQTMRRYNELLYAVRATAGMNDNLTEEEAHEQALKTLRNERARANAILDENKRMLANRGCDFEGEPKPAPNAEPVGHVSDDYLNSKHPCRLGDISGHKSEYLRNPVYCAPHPCPECSRVKADHDALAALHADLSKQIDEAWKALGSPPVRGMTTLADVIQCRHDSHECAIAEMKAKIESGEYTKAAAQAIAEYGDMQAMWYEAEAKVRTLSLREPTREEMETVLGDADEAFLNGTVRRCVDCKRPIFGGPTRCCQCVGKIEGAEKAEARLRPVVEAAEQVLAEETGNTMALLANAVAAVRALGDLPTKQPCEEFATLRADLTRLYNERTRLLADRDQRHEVVEKAVKKLQLAIGSKATDLLALSDEVEAHVASMRVVCEAARVYVAAWLPMSVEGKALGEVGK